MNPLGGFTEFVKKDTIKNIDVSRDSRPAPPDISAQKEKWAVGTTNFIYTTGKITQSGANLDRTNIEGFPKNAWRNPTDNITSIPPTTDRPFQSVFDQMVTKRKYNMAID